MLQADIRPKLALHGGDIRLLDFQDGVLRFELLGQCSGCPSASITTEELIRPGLPLKGFFEHFNPERLQVIGQVETTYLQGMSHEERAERLDQFFTYDFPAVIISRGVEPLP